MNIQKISSIHPFILAIQQILEYHDLKGATPNFNNAYPIIIIYPKFVSPFKKSVIPLIPLLYVANLKVL